MTADTECPWKAGATKVALPKGSPNLLLGVSLQVTKPRATEPTISEIDLPFMLPSVPSACRLCVESTAKAAAGKDDPSPQRLNAPRERPSVRVF